MIVNDFQKHIESYKASFNDDELGLFHDSVRCFHAGIYRPAYIMAYQAMMIYFRRLIQGAKRPTGFDTTKWNVMQLNLANDKTWEEEVNNAIRKQANPRATPPEVPILVMTDALRKDFDFWRNRRNDCAHYKEYIVNDSHVLAFYSFLTQYLMKISVEGGMKTLLNEFSDACDPTKTSPKASLQPLIDKILVMVSPDEMDTFFEDLDGAMGYRFNGRYESLLASIIKGGNEELKGYVIKFARKDKRFKADLINSNPDLVGHLLDKTEVREFWVKYLNGCRNRVAILARMLMVGLIDPSEKDEAIKKVLEHSYKNNQGVGDVTEEELLMLRASDFFSILKDTYFNSDYACSHAKDCGGSRFDFFYGYVSSMQVDKEFVEIMVDLFSHAGYPYIWLNIFKEHFLENDALYKAKFEKVASDNGITLPKCLKVE